LVRARSFKIFLFSLPPPRFQFFLASRPEFLPPTPCFKTSPPCTITLFKFPHGRIGTPEEKHDHTLRACSLFRYVVFALPVSYFMFFPPSFLARSKQSPFSSRFLLHLTSYLRLSFSRFPLTSPLPASEVRALPRRSCPPTRWPWFFSKFGSYSYFFFLN